MKAILYQKSGFPTISFIYCLERWHKQLQNQIILMVSFTLWSPSFGNLGSGLGEQISKLAVLNLIQNYCLHNHWYVSLCVLRNDYALICQGQDILFCWNFYFPKQIIFSMLFISKVHLTNSTSQSENHLHFKFTIFTFFIFSLIAVFFFFLAVLIFVFYCVRHNYHNLLVVYSHPERQREKKYKLNWFIIF